MIALTKTFQQVNKKEKLGELISVEEQIVDG